jgi:hypothetical protein
MRVLLVADLFFNDVDIALPVALSPPDCVAALIDHSFAFSYGAPAVEPFKVSQICSQKPWKKVVLSLFTTCNPSVQYDRISAIWIGGLEGFFFVFYLSCKFCALQHRSQELRNLLHIQ